MAKGSLNPEQYQSDYHRVFTEGVSREVCNICASSVHEIELFRDALRVNSTRMRRSVWQSKNLPRAQISPWMATCLTPLYSEKVFVRCDELSENIRHALPSDEISLLETMFELPSLFIKIPFSSCATCFVKKIKFNKYSRCKSLTYCSTSCQKAWPKHKLACSSS